MGKSKNMNNKLTVTVGIPAYNEEATIQNILESTVKQKGTSFILEKVIVMCDGCTDTTEQKAKAYAKKYKQIEIISDGQRKGKVNRLNELYRKNKSDIFINFDADIALATEYTIEELVKTFLQNEEAVMVVAHEIPICPNTFIGKVIYAGYTFWDKSRLSIANYDHIQNHYGAATALKKSLVERIHFPPDITDDRGYVYLFAKKHGKFIYTMNAIIYYHPVNTLHDFLKLADRSFSKNQDALVKYFGPSVYDYYAIPKKNILKAIFSTFLSNPIYTILALGLNAYTRLIPHHDNHYEEGMWEISKSTKKAISLKKKF